MQGFNKYYPPDYDGEKHKSLNAYRGKHALGDRARKLDQGILITRFELPFNIWCGTCNNHIGMGVRYNAEKKKIGNYYSTPIFEFRCKCHLCDGWFKIQTDPKNTRYVVTEGARQKDEEWDPEENGGYAIHDTEGNAAPADPLAALEKTTDAQNHMTKVQQPRLEELEEASERFNADPYALSRKVRKHFRAEKKVEQKKRTADDEIKNRYGLPEELNLASARDDEGTISEAKAAWAKGKRELEQRQSEAAKRRKLGHSQTSISLPASTSLPASSSAKKKGGALDSLRSTILQNTARNSLRRR
ncbi:CWC16 protein [Schizophyllum amplum]|uniref:CWC16 protein n=1 Tax=Schizophyllum amplum TaxID=97359 RepID=A0A550CJL3_9AGAR|nr:CWC16 protein [Auriculariopsis ampla]